MKKYILLFLLIPNLIFAQGTVGGNIQTQDADKLHYSGLVQCDGVITPGETYRKNVCDFNDLLGTVKFIINWIFIISIPLATALFAYAGILYLTGTQGNIGTAKDIFSSVAKGFIIMLIAWFAVVTVVNWFVEKNSGADIFINTSK